MNEAPRRPPRPSPQLLDMTPEGGFRDPPPPSWLDRLLARTGGIAALVALVAGGLALAALALLFIGLLLPVAILAGGIAAVSLWWRMRQLRKQGIEPRIFIVKR
jgi:hypothetical protein